MSIKIIKQGKTGKFTKACPYCGCEFEYEQGDVKVNYDTYPSSYSSEYDTYVICPCCGKHLPHKRYHYTAYYNNSHIKYIPPEKEFIVTNCDNCPNKPDPKNVVTGDSPCDWCIKRQFTYK